MTKQKAAPSPRISLLGMYRRIGGLLKNNWKLIGGIVLVYALLSFYFGQGLSFVDVTGIKENNLELGINDESLPGRILLAGQVFLASAAQDEVGSIFMLFITVITTLALIWVLRHIYSKKPTTLKMSYYESMYPLVPFFLLLGLAMVQLLPLLGGLYLYEVARDGVLINSVEVIVGLIILVILPLIWSVFMLLKTVFALFIVTIPGMKPMESYRSAKELIKGRRAYLLKHLLLAGVLSLLVVTALLVAVIALVPGMAAVAGILLNALYLPFFVVLTYILYRGLISESEASTPKSR